MVSNIDIFQGIVSKFEIPVSWQHYFKGQPIRILKSNYADQILDQWDSALGKTVNTNV